jgi:uncharacterized protein YaiE (UPF0345 family)
MISKISAQCTTGTQYPAGIYQATGAAGTGTINSDARTGQFAYVHVQALRYYTFTSSVATDYLTITNDTGTQVIASGVTPVSYVSIYDESVRFYIHQNAQCQTTDQFVRNRKVTWVTAQDCQVPTPTTVTDITPVSCNLNFTPPAIAPYFGYEAYVSTSSATPGLSVPVHSATSTATSVFVSYLNPDTTYYYWIRSNCDYQKGEWVYGGTFTTISSLLCNSAYNGINPSSTVTLACTGSDEWIATDVRSSSFASVAVVANTQYTFKTNNSNDFITITNALGTVVYATGFTPLSWNSASTSGVVRFYNHDDAQCGYGVSMVGTRNKYVSCVTSSVTCFPPTNIAVSNITSNSIRMSWTAPTSAPSGGYDIYIVTTNTAPTANSAATHTSTTIPKDINGLTAGVTYYYWIRSNCGTEKSSWASGGSFTMNQSFSCNGAIYGLFPNATFTPSCTGSAEAITSTAYAGQFTNVNITASQQYVFSSSVSTDFISITNSAGTAILATGLTPLSWNSGTNTGLVRYYLHSNSSCASQNTNRVKYMQCPASSSCGVPSALAVSNITSNSCRLTWTAPATAPASYDIYIITTNTAPISTTTASATSTTAGVGVLNGLAAATTYYYWIRSNCTSAKSAWVSGGNFTTIAALTCNGATNGLYPDATFTPTCSGTAQQIATDSYAGEYSNVNVVASTQYTFSSSITTDYITITNALGTTVLASGTTPLSWTSGTYAGVIRYHISTNSSCGIQSTNRIRSIQCSGVVATCGIPSALAVSNITSNSCRLSWTAPATAPTSYDIYLSTSSTAPVTATAATTTSGSNVVGALNGLTSSTTYYYWVRSNCNGTKSTWVSGGSFVTLTSLTCNGAYYGLYPATTFTPACTGSSEAIVSDAYAGEYTNVNVLSGKQYTFTSSVTTDYITITNQGGTAVLASGLTPLTWVSNFAGVIRYHLNTNSSCGTQNTSRVRSITCATPTGCNAPTQLFYDGLGTTTNNIGWTAAIPAPSNGYVYCYSTVNDPYNSAAITLNTTNTVVTLSNLLPNTTYYFWVKSNCGSTQSSWAQGGSFTTYSTSTCNAPTQLFYDGLGSTTNNIGWAAPIPVPSNGYVYCYSTVNDPFSSAAITGNTTDTFAVLSNLLPNTTYYFWVKSNCGTTQTNWVSGGSFTTYALGIDTFSMDKIKLYPNPVKSIFTISLDKKITKVSVFNLLGQEVLTKSVNSNETTVDVAHLTAGTYLVKITSGDETKTVKIIKK